MKKVVFPCQLMVDFDELGEVTLSANYGVASEDVTQGRNISLELTTAQVDQIKKFAQNVILPKIKKQEGI